MSVDEAVLRVAWPDDLEGNTELFAGVQRANEVLREELGASQGLVTADWKLVWDGQNRPLLTLTLTDLFTKSQAVEKFAPAEFRDETNLDKRIHRLWGRLLHARTDAQIKRLKELVGPEEGE